MTYYGLIVVGIENETTIIGGALGNSRIVYNIHTRHTTQQQYIPFKCFLNRD